MKIGDSIFLKIQNNTNDCHVLYIDPKQISVDLIEKNVQDTIKYNNKVFLDRNILSLSLRLREEDKKKKIKDYKEQQVEISPHRDTNDKKFTLHLKNYTESNKIELRPQEKLEIVINLQYDKRFKANYEFRNQKYWLSLVYNGEFIKYVCDRYSSSGFVCDSSAIYENIESNSVKFCTE